MVGSGARSREEGAAAVEFALVSVLLFPILFAILQYGYYFFELQTAQSVLRDVVRQASLGWTCPAFEDAVDQRVGSSAPPLTLTRGAVTQSGDLATVTLTFTFTDFGFPILDLPGIGGGKDLVAVTSLQDTTEPHASCTWTP